MAIDHCGEVEGPWTIPEVPDYFHGELTQKEAEKRLRCYSIPNSYLLRLSIYENEEAGQISINYALSFLTSKLVCQHYKLVPRLRSFQLGRRLFQCLKCILSRYYRHPIVPGEFLRFPIPPCSPPQEFYKRRLRAVRIYEPPCNLRLRCKPGDEFLVVDDRSHPDWILVNSVQTRLSGYLPKFCLEKVYPEIIEQLLFFHENGTSPEQQELLKQNGPFSYLLRPCNYKPGFYVLLVYDGIQILEYKLATSVVWWPASSQQPVNGGQAASEKGSDEVSSATPHRAFTLPLYRSEVKIRYKNLWYSSVEKVVSAVQAHLNQSPSEAPHRAGFIELKPVKREPKLTPSQDSIYVNMSFNRRPSSPRAVVEIHGELSMLLPQKKKWKPLYASLDREHSVMMLTSGDKRKPERINLSSCDFFPIHSRMFDKPHCFGLLLSSTDVHEDYVFAVEPPYSCNQLCGGFSFMSSSSATTSNPSLSPATVPQQQQQQQQQQGPNSTCSSSSGTTTATTTTSSGFSSLSHNNNACLSSGLMNLDPLAYAGRSNSVSTPTGKHLDPLQGCYSSGDGLRSNIPKATGCSVPVALGSCAMGGGGGGGVTSSPVDLAYTRWLKALAIHCRNTRLDAVVESDPERRRTELANAKLLPMPLSGRREGMAYSVCVDDVEIARAYSGATNQTITFQEFPDGFKKVAAYMEVKKKRQLLTELELITPTSTARPSQQVAATEFTGAINLSLPGHSRGHAYALDSRENPTPKVSSSARLAMPICSFRESVSPHVTLTYRELHVLPFHCYDKLRKVITTHLETELVPVCTYMWSVLANDRGDFPSSLLFACIESKRHLELIVHLLKDAIPSENVGGAFRSNCLAQVVMDQYMNMVCSDWRQKCFRRIFDEVEKGCPTSSVWSPSPSSPKSSASSSKIAKSSSACEKFPPSEIYEASSVYSSATLAGDFHRLSTHSTDKPRDVSPVAANITSSPSSSLPSAPRPPNCSSEADWHRKLIELFVEDLIEYAKEFPLQIRWIYSELQRCPKLQSKNVVLCNLLCLRGLCPSICKGCDSSRAESPTLHKSKAAALKVVAKSFISLTSQNPNLNDNCLPRDLFISFRDKLLTEFASHVLSPLSTEELKRLESLYIEEAVRASAISMSRELAQLASFFQLVFLPNSPTSENGNWENVPTLLNRKQLAAQQKPLAPNLCESLLELDQLAPMTITTTSVGAHNEAEVSTTGTTHSRSGRELIRGLGGIFGSSSTSFSSSSVLPKKSGANSSNPSST